MNGRKGSSVADEGYSCSQRVLIEGWRAILRSRIWGQKMGSTGTTFAETEPGVWF